MNNCIWSAPVGCILYITSSLFSLRFICLKGRERRKDIVGSWGERNLPSTCSLPNAQQPGLNQTESRSSKLNPVSHLVLTPALEPPSAVSQSAHWGRDKSQNLHHADMTRALHMAASSSTPQCQYHSTYLTTRPLLFKVTCNQFSRT